VAIAARRAEGYREKAPQFVVRAPVRFIRSAGHCRCWRELTWLASGLCVALRDAAGPTGEGSTARVEAGKITPAAEAVDADPEIVAMGRRSLSLWPQPH
jgi:hypothetical protein